MMASVKVKLKKNPKNKALQTCNVLKAILGNTFYIPDGICEYAAIFSAI